MGQGEGDRGKLGQGDPCRGFGSVEGAGPVCQGSGKGRMLGELRAASPDPGAGPDFKPIRAVTPAPQRRAALCLRQQTACLPGSLRTEAPD